MIMIQGILNGFTSSTSGKKELENFLHEMEEQIQNWVDENEINAVIGQQQLEAYDQIINIFKSVNRDEKIDLLKRNHIQKCIQWCEKNNISHNKFIDSVNIFFKVKKDIDNDDYTDNYNKFNAVAEYDNSVPYEDTDNV